MRLADDGIRLPDPDLIAAIRTLPPKQRAVVVLFYGAVVAQVGFSDSLIRVTADGKVEPMVTK